MAQDPGYGTTGDNPAQSPPPARPPYGTPLPPQPGYGQAPPPYGTPLPPQSGYGQAPNPYDQQPPAYGYSGSSGPLSAAEERQWAMLGHLGGILGFVPPLILWMIFRERGAFTDDQNREALNFEITVGLGAVGAMFVNLVLSLLGIPVLGSLMLLGIMGANTTCCIMGAMAANQGQRFRYPFALRLLT
jgi:uncharacterized Tic20 family protein